MKNLVLIVALAVTLVGCVQQPTAMTTVNDTSPTVNFTHRGDGSGLELVIDGISYGSLGHYLAPKQALKLVPGKHVIEIRTAQGTAFTQEVYLSESTHRTIETNL